MNGDSTSTTQLRELLAQYRPICAVDNELCISSHLIRATDGTALAGVGGEHSISARDRINLFADALVWYHRHFNNGGTMRFVLGAHPDIAPVLSALSTLCRLLEGQLQVQLEVDQEPVGLCVPDFTVEEDPWAETLLNRGDMPSPDLAQNLEHAAGCPSFRWYYTLMARRWSGRVEGLEVCQLAPDGMSGIMKVGNPGREGAVSQARRRFIELAGREEIPFDGLNLEEVIQVIRNVANDREAGVLAGLEREHHLESRVLRGAVPVRLQDGTELAMVQTDHAFQLPTRWHPGGTPKFLDVLMQSGTTPWAVELKVAEPFHVRYYRHAVCQVVLYREFIRHSNSFFPWFNRHGLDPTRCKAAVAFPQPGPMNKTAEAGLDDIKWLANLFQVEVITLDNA